MKITIGKIETNTNIPIHIFILLDIILIIFTLMFSYENISFYVNSEKIMVTVTDTTRRIGNESNGKMVYVDYEYNGNKYHDIELRGLTSNESGRTKINDIIEARIDKRNAEYVSKIGSYIFINIFALFLTIGLILITFIRKRGV